MNHPLRSLPVPLRAALALLFVLGGVGEAMARPRAPVPAEVRAPDVHLLAIGISRYQHYRANILYAEKDAQAIAETLTAALATAAGQGLQVGEVHAHVLTGLQASAGNVRREMKAIAEEARPEDLFVFFFSGYADLLGEDRAHCLLLVDSPQGEAALQEALPTWQLTALVNKIPTERMLLMLDTCDSADALAEFTRQVSGAGGSGLHVGVISPVGEALEDRDAGHGVFTSFLLEVFRGASASDANADGMLSFLELRQDLAGRHSDIDQDFRVGSQLVGDDFLVCPAPTAPPAPAAGDPQAAAEAPPRAPTRISLVRPTGVVGEGETLLHLQATGQRAGRILRVNGVDHPDGEVHEALASAPPAGAGGDPRAEAVTTFQVPITLEVGENPVAVELLDANGATEAVAEFRIQAERVLRDFSARPRGTRVADAAAGAPGVCHALIISTDEYDPSSGWKNLRYPSKDAARLEAVLKNTYGVETRTIVNAATKDVQDVVMEYQQREFGANDQLLVFLAGHGYRADNLESGYLVCTDSRKPDDSWMSTYIHFNNLLKQLNQVPCAHILLLVDICHGGGIIEEAKRDADYTEDRTRFCIASGGPLQRVPDQSAFASRIIGKLEQADEKWISQNTLYGEVEFDIEPLPWAGAFGTSPARSGFRIYPVRSEDSDG